MDLTEPSDDPPRILALRLEVDLVRRVVRLGTWVMLAVITQFFVNAADTFMVGRLDAAVATPSQAALGLGMPLFWAVGGFFSAVSFGTQAMTARRYAAGETHEAGRVLQNALYVGVAAGLAGALIGWFVTAPAIGYLAEASEEQRRLGVAYTSLRMLGIPGMVVTFAYKAFFDGIGRTWVHLWAALAMNVFNVGLNALLIFGVPSLGIPRLELEGAAIASVISTYVGLAIMIVASVGRGTRPAFALYRSWRPDALLLRPIVRLMLPSGTATVILMAGFLLFMRFVGLIDAGTGGNAHTAATKAIMDTMALCFMPLIAFGTATATCVSQSLGAGKPNLAARYGWEAVRVGVLVMTLAGIGLVAFSGEILAVWAPHDPEVALVGARSLRIIALSLPAMVAGLVLSQALYGAGANTYVMWVELVLHFGVLVPLSWLLGPRLGGGLEGVWVAATVYIILLGVAMTAKFAGRGWRSIRI
jgi:putative MATE family efflux protein